MQGEGRDRPEGKREATRGQRWDLSCKLHSYIINYWHDASNVRKNKILLLKLMVMLMPMHWHPHQERVIMKRILRISLIYKRLHIKMSEAMMPISTYHFAMWGLSKPVMMSPKTLDGHMLIRFMQSFSLLQAYAFKSQVQLMARSLNVVIAVFEMPICNVRIKVSHPVAITVAFFVFESICRVPSPSSTNS